MHASTELFDLKDEKKYVYLTLWSRVKRKPALKKSAAESRDPRRFIQDEVTISFPRYFHVFSSITRQPPTLSHIINVMKICLYVIKCSIYGNERYTELFYIFLGARIVS